MRKFFTQKNRFKFTLVVALLLVAAAIYGFAAANVVPETGAGDGSADVSGYTIANVTYTNVDADPETAEAVVFDVTPTAGAAAATTVWVSMDGGTTWDSCAGPGPTWTCTFATPVNIAGLGAGDLQIVATQ